MDRFGVFALLLSATGPASADVILSCSFPTLPSAVMTFPEGIDAEKQLSIGNRPAVQLIEGQGSGRLITASVDGYDFRFAPENSVMDVEQGGVKVASEQGACVTIGGPANSTPLTIAAAKPADEPVANETQDTPENTGAWVVTEDKSAFDDSRTVVLSLDSIEPIRSQFGAPGPARIYLRCQENTTSLFVVLNDLFLADIQGFGAVDYRIDDQKADSVRMASSTDNKALGLWDGGGAIPFIKKLESGKKVVFRATPYNESPVEVSFDLAGLASALIPLKEACKWS